MKDLHLILEELIPVMEEAGEIISGVRPMAVDEKSGHADLVTEYDIYVQHLLEEKLALIDPDAFFMGEEEEQTGDAQAEELYIIDPIDGTANFVYGYRHSCISVGLRRHGEIQLAAIYHPWEKAMYTAIKGEGAFMNGKPIHVADSDLANSLVDFGSCPYYEDLRKRTVSVLSVLIDRVQDIRRRGSAALDLCDAAAGRCGAFFELRLSPWDYAAGSLLVTEAGGQITNEHGKPVSFTEKSSVVAGGKKACLELLSILKDIQ